MQFGGSLAVVSIAVSFLVIIVAVSVSDGFRSELREGLSDVSGDIRLSSPSTDISGQARPVHLDGIWMAALRQMPAVKSVEPVIYRPGIIRGGGPDGGVELGGAIFKGVPGGPDSLGADIPARLAEKLSLKPGDRLQAYFIGDKVKIRNFSVRKIREDILSSDDKLVVRTSLEDMRRLAEWTGDECSAVEIKLMPSERTTAGMKAACSEISDLVFRLTPEDEEVPVAFSALNLYPQIFSWLDLLDMNVLMILVLMSLVAGFNMISGLLIMLLRNVSTIGILKSLGMDNRQLASLFVRVSSRVVLKGMLIGNALALAFCFLQGRFHLLKLNPENYFVSFVPVAPDLLRVLAADLSAFLVILLLLILPSLYVSRIDPARTVRVQ